MTTNEYHYTTYWRIKGTVEEVSEVLSQATDLVRWWPSVYLDVQEGEPGGDRHEDRRGVRSDGDRRAGRRQQCQVGAAHVAHSDALRVRRKRRRRQAEDRSRNRVEDGLAVGPSFSAGV